MNILKIFGIGQTEEERVEKAYQAYRKDQRKAAEIGLVGGRGFKCSGCGNHTTDNDRYCGLCGKAIF